MEFLYFFGDRFEVFEDGVGGGLERSKGLHHYCPSVIDGMGGIIKFLQSVLCRSISFHHFVSVIKSNE